MDVRDNNCVVSSCAGIGLYVYDGTLELESVSFERNIATSTTGTTIGSALYAESSTLDASDVYASDNRFVGTNGYGAIALDDCDATFSSLEVSNNVGTSYYLNGLGMYLANSDVVMDESLFADNTVPISTGAAGADIYTTGTDLTVTNSVFVGSRLIGRAPRTGSAQPCRRRRSRRRTTRRRPHRARRPRARLRCSRAPAPRPPRRRPRC